MADQTTYIPAENDSTSVGIPVGTAGHSQQVAQVVATDNNTTTIQSGPNAAFAELRRQNEEYQKQLSQYQQDTELAQWLKDREEYRRQEEQARLQQPQVLAQELEQLKQWQAQQQATVYQNQIAENERNFKTTYQMDDSAYESFIGAVNDRFNRNGEITNQLRVNPQLDLTPYLAAIYPDRYAAFMSARTGAAQTAAPAQAVFVPGHSNGNQTPMFDKALSDRIAARVKDF